MVNCENEWIEFKSSAIHGIGGFAKKRIPQGTLIIEYVGEKISKEESRKRCVEGNHYIFQLDDNTDIDGNVDWNPAKYINHSCQPNCESRIINGHICIVAIRDIEPGEEITFNYGYDLEKYWEHPCNCGSPNCVGFIIAEEFFPLVREETKNLNKTKY